MMLCPHCEAEDVRERSVGGPERCPECYRLIELAPVAVRDSDTGLLIAEYETRAEAEEAIPRLLAGLARRDWRRHRPVPDHALTIEERR